MGRVFSTRFWGGTYLESIRASSPSTPRTAWGVFASMTYHVPWFSSSADPDTGDEGYAELDPVPGIGIGLNGVDST